MSRIHFSRAPYTVSYYKNGERHTIRRRPPEKIHDMWPDDVVSLTRSKNDDYQAGDEFNVKHINTRHPNVLQLEDDDGNRTFVSAYDLNLEEAIGYRDGVDPRDMEINNKYLLWP